MKEFRVLTQIYKRGKLVKTEHEVFMHISLEALLQDLKLQYAGLISTHFIVISNILNKDYQL